MHPSLLAAALSLAGAGEAQAQNFGLPVRKLQQETKYEIDGVLIQHQFSTDYKDWHHTQTPNFQVRHHLIEPRANALVLTLERERAKALLLWNPAKAEGKWSPKCNVYIYPDSPSYQHAQGVPKDTPGHARVHRDKGTHRIVGLEACFSLRAPLLHENVIPHEVTHLVLAHCVKNPPRWFDEGAAVGAETKQKRQTTKNDLHKMPHGELFTFEQLFAQKEYVTAKQFPNATLKNRLLYLQGYRVTEFLIERKGRPALVQFVRDGEKGHEEASQTHYGLSLRELDQEWREKEFTAK